MEKFREVTSTLLQFIWGLSFLVLLVYGVYMTTVHKVDRDLIEHLEGDRHHQDSVQLILLDKLIQKYYK